MKLHTAISRTHHAHKNAQLPPQQQQRNARNRWKTTATTMTTLPSAGSLSSLGSESTACTLRSQMGSGFGWTDKGREGKMVELRFAAHNLVNADFLSLSDPFAVIYAERPDETLVELGRTETVVDDLSPRWTATLVLPQHSCASHTLVVDVYDRDGATHALERHDHLGRARISVADVLAIPSRTYAALLTRGPSARRRIVSLARSPRGTLRILAEPLRAVPNTTPKKIELRVRAAALRTRRRDTVQFFELARARPTPMVTGAMATDWAVVYRSEDGVHVDRHGYIRFRATRITEQLLHNMDHNRPLRISFYARQTRRAHEEIAHFDTDANSLTQKQAVPLRRDIVDRSFCAESSGVSSISSAYCLDDDDEAEECDSNSGYMYVEDVQQNNGDTTIVYLLCDHSSSGAYTSMAADTSVPERVVRKIPAFISLH